MARGKNSKPDSKITSELNILNYQNLRINVLDTLPWKKPPLCWLTPEQQTEVTNELEIRQYQLGEKIWLQETGEYQFFIVTGKVRLRDEKSKPVATLNDGDWFGDLQQLFTNCKAVAASKEVVVVCWNSSLWEKFSHPQIDEFWHGKGDREQVTGEEEPSMISDSLIS